jgi:hypothetical protein
MRSPHDVPMQVLSGGGGFAPTHSQLDTRRGWMVSTTLQLFYPRERPLTQCTGGRVGLGTGLDGTENLTPSGFDPRTVQLVAGCYTAYAIPATRK